MAPPRPHWGWGGANHSEVSVGQVAGVNTACSTSQKYSVGLWDGTNDVKDVITGKGVHRSVGTMAIIRNNGEMRNMKITWDREPNAVSPLYPFFFGQKNTRGWC